MSVSLNVVSVLHILVSVFKKPSFILCQQTLNHLWSSVFIFWSITRPQEMLLSTAQEKQSLSFCIKCRYFLLHRKIWFFWHRDMIFLVLRQTWSLILSIVLGWPPLRLLWMSWNISFWTKSLDWTHKKIIKGLECILVVTKSNEWSSTRR